MSHKDEGLKTRHRQYWKKIEADSVVLDPGIIAISWEDSTIRLHDGYTIGGRIFPMSPAPSLTVNVLTPLSGNGSVSSPISLNIAALANQVPVLANAPIIGTGVIGNPLDLDIVALASALANAVPVAHDATLVGNGTAGAPLSVNWGLAPAPTIAHNGTLSGAGTPASPLAVVPNSLASLVAVSAISPITGDGKIATPLALDVAALLPQLHNNVTVYTDGTTITGSGTTANPLVAVPQTPVVVTSSPIVGNGTLANPIDINIVSAIAEISAAGGVPVVHNTSMLGNGTTASPLGVDWSQQPALNVQHDGSMTGQGTAGNPLSVNWASAPAINVQHDGTMTGSGTAGSPLSVNGLALAAQVPVAVNAGLSGNGTAGSPIAINPGVLGPMLSGLVPIAVSAPLTGVGTSASPLGITNASGALRGVVQLATAAEGLQPANDTDAVTPAYITTAIGAQPHFLFSELQTETNLTKFVDGQVLATFIRHDLQQNIAVGFGALDAIGSGSQGVNALGFRAGDGLIGNASWSQFIGYGAGQFSTGVRKTAIGVFASRNTNSADSVHIGFSSADAMPGTANGFGTFVGNYSGYNSSGVSNSFFGYIAGRIFQGNESVGIGRGSLDGTLGTNAGVTAVGNYTASICNNLQYVDCYGNGAGTDLQNASYTSLLGSFAGAFGNNLNRGVAVGYAAAEASSGSDFVYAGYTTGVGWFGDQATLLGSAIQGNLTAPVPVTLTVPNIINYAGHGIPIAESRAFRLTATMYPGGIPGPMTVLARAATVNTLELLLGMTFTSPGAGVQLELYNGAFSNCAGIGYQAAPTADNQIKLGNALVAEIRTSAQHYAAGYNIVSDKRLKDKFEAVPDAAAIEFSRAISFTSFIRIKEQAQIAKEFDARIDSIKSEMLYADMSAKKAAQEKANNGKNPVKVENPSADADDVSTLPPAAVVPAKPIRSADELQVALTAAEKEKAEAIAPANLLFANRQVGVIAQEVLELAKKVGWGEFLVHEDGGYYTVDFTSLLAVIARGFQLRLEKAGI